MSKRKFLCPVMEEKFLWGIFRPFQSCNLTEWKEIESYNSAWSISPLGAQYEMSLLTVADAILTKSLLSQRGFNLTK